MILCMATQQGGAEIMADKCPTITASAGMSGNNQPVIVLETFHIRFSDKVTEPLKARNYKDPLVVLDRAAYNQGENAKYDFEARVGGCHRRLLREVQGRYAIGALCHDDYKFPQQQQIEQGKVVIEVSDEYIVRRLMPIECGRLQGFPDGWGEIDPKEDFTDEEYQFWLEVRNHWAEINGKQVKEYTKDQMVKWYNKLHTDSTEYKMWGNGIGLPNALYMMEGIEEALRGEDNE